MYRLAYRNFGDHESLVVNHSITAGSSVGVRWYELRNPNGAVNVFQSGTYAPDSAYRWMRSIATDKAGNMGLGYSKSSSSIFPSIYFTGRETGDPLGTMQTESLLISGGGSQQPTLSRWGDYSAMRIDPSDDCTFWYTTEYLRSSGTFNWSTQVGSFKFSSCGAPASPPAAPSNLVATAVSSRIDLTWQDNSNNESGFKIERCQGTQAFCNGAPANYSQIATTAANVTSYQDTGLTASTTYTYRVRAFNGGGDSGYSNNSSATTQAAPPTPNAPSNLTAGALNTYQISLTWQDNSNNEDGFNVYRCVGCADPKTGGTKVASVGANVTTYTDGSSSTPLNQSTTYTYQVTAFNGSGESGASNNASATTQTEAAPTNLQSSARSNGQRGNRRKDFVDLTWSDNSGDEDSYRVERCAGAGCSNFSEIATTGANAVSYTDNTVALRTTYSYRVRAHSPGGFSTYSNVSTVTTP
jgi:hypothetical protein